MKKFIVLLFVSFTVSFVFGQKAYIQVSGESGLSVYLNNQFKGKTSAEYSGYIIENVTPGKNLVKIVKEGYTPYEENITVKPGEVFEFKVKPFTKHVVRISEHGNTGETDKKATIETGKLVIQSVPIGIKITMPAIEGINNTPKTKDEWVADKIPAGNYNITFTFNQKVINKTVEISGNETTSVFVNMMSGEFKAKNSLDETIAKEREAATKHAIMYHFLDSVMKQYKFKIRIKEDAYRRYNPEATGFMFEKNRRTSWDKGYGFYEKSSESNAPGSVSFDKNKELIAYTYNILYGKKKESEVTAYYNKLVAQLERTIPKEFLIKKDSQISVYYRKMNVQVIYVMHHNTYDKTSLVYVHLLVIDR